MNTETNFCLRVDVDTFEGLKLGIPRVVELSSDLECSITIYLSLGKFATGRNLFRKIRSREKIVKRIPPWVRNHPKSIIRGLLIPPRKIKEKEKKILQEYNRESSIEFHPHGYNHVKWSSAFTKFTFEKTKEIMKSMIEEYSEIFEKKPIANAAPNFQVNEHYFQILKEENFSFSADLRHPEPISLQFRDRENQQGTFQIPQLPVTETSIEEFILQGKTLNQIRNGYKKRFENAVDQGKEYVCLYVHSIYEPIKLNKLLEDIISLVFKFDMKSTTHNEFFQTHPDFPIIQYDQLGGSKK